MLPVELNKNKISTVNDEFIKSVNLRLALGKAPKCLLQDPLLIGQVIHKIAVGSSIYVMATKEISSDVHYLKIGIAQNIQKRLSAITTSCPLPIKKAMYFCVGPLHETYKIEQGAHQELAPFRINGEWFSFGDKSTRDEQTGKIIAFMEERLGERFNSFVYDLAKVEDKNLPVALSFAQEIMESTVGQRFMNDPFKRRVALQLWGKPKSTRIFA